MILKHKYGVMSKATDALKTEDTIIVDVSDKSVDKVVKILSKLLL